MIHVAHPELLCAQGHLSRRFLTYEGWYSIVCISPKVSHHIAQQIVQQHYPDEIDAIVATRKVVIGKTDNLPRDGSPEDFDEQTVQWVKGFISPEEDPTEPINVIYYPILAKSNEQVKSRGGKDDLLGVLALTGFWREFVKDILVRAFADDSV